MPVARSDIVAEARTWIGTPWRHQRCVKAVGVDCGQLIAGVLRELGVRDVVITGYARIPDGSLRGICEQHMKAVPVSQAQPGDAVLMRFDTEPQHLGILGDYPHGGLSLIHSTLKNRKVVEHRLDDRWRNYCVAAYSILEAP
ncbi:NlpC/P60 family protein [Methylibium sp.]|uniref:NlpC/P60 family protein n=1 Tax=Methylibium sp. TaxID=2067992 RepID=UPI003BAB3592